MKQACDVLNTMRIHVAECKDTQTMVQILDLLDDAEMAFETETNTWRTCIAVAEAQGEPWWAFEAAISCLVEDLRLMQTAYEKGQQNQLSGDDNGWPVESTPRLVLITNRTRSRCICEAVRFTSIGL